MATGSGSGGGAVVLATGAVAIKIAEAAVPSAADSRTEEVISTLLCTVYGVYVACWAVAGEEYDASSGVSVVICSSACEFEIASLACVSASSGPCWDGAGNDVWAVREVRSNSGACVKCYNGDPDSPAGASVGE